MFDPAAAAARYLPFAPIVLNVTDTSTAFTLVNDTPDPLFYVFVNTVPIHINPGGSDITPATTGSMLLLAGEHDFILPAKSGVRVLRSGADDGQLFIGNTSRSPK